MTAASAGSSEGASVPAALLPSEAWGGSVALVERRKPADKSAALNPLVPEEMVEAERA